MSSHQQDSPSSPNKILKDSSISAVTCTKILLNILYTYKFIYMKSKLFNAMKINLLLDIDGSR